MYVLSPAKDAKEVKEFIHKWNTNDQKMFSTRKDPKDFTFPLQNLVSICALLVWQPANPTDTITRLLFPGSTPQHKIFEGLDRLKHLEFMKHPVCTAKTLTPSGSILGLKSRQVKGSTVLDKIIPPEPRVIKINDNKQQKEKSPPPLENKSKVENKSTPTENKNKINGTTNGEVKPTDVIKRDSMESEKSDPTSDTKKTENEGKSVASTPLTSENKSDTKNIKKEDAKPKPELKPKLTNKSRSESLSRRAQDKKPKPADKKTEQKTSPKKIVEAKVNGTVKEKEPAKPKLISRTAVKSSPTSTPAKSTKDANNRKVVESKYKPAPKKEAAKPSAEKKEIVKVERKPISRRPKAASPARTNKVIGSPTKKVAGAKIDKNGVSRTIKLDKEGTTDSSAVSTPSADQDTLKKIDESKLTKTEIEELRAKELADLKEEQEVVKEIEAVFQKDEGKKAVTEPTDLRKIKDMSLEEKTTEPEEEEEEYIIIEKEEVEQYTEDSINEHESAAKGEDEIQKLQRDSEESEKPGKISEDEKQTPATNQENIQEDNVVEPELIKAATCEVLEIVQPKENEEEVVIGPSADMTRSKEDSRDKTEEMSKEMSMTSPEDKLTSSEKKTTDTRDLEEEEEEEEEVKAPGDQNYIVESQPDEKFSTTIESGATTAPTLPEDERIPLDEIKEDIVDQVVEEKYVKEETKETEVPIVVVPPTTFEPMPKMAPVAGMKFDAHQQHLRDIVKTPDEVADLPMHEEVDIDYEYPPAFKKDEGKKVQDQKEDIHVGASTSKPAEKEEAKVEEPEIEIPPEEQIKAKESPSKDLQKDITEDKASAQEQHEEETKPEETTDVTKQTEDHETVAPSHSVDEKVDIVKPDKVEELHAHITEVHEHDKVNIQKVNNEVLEKEIVMTASTSYVAKEEKHELPADAEEKTSEKIPDTNKLEEFKIEEVKESTSTIEQQDHEEKADLQKDVKDSEDTTPEKIDEIVDNVIPDAKESVPEPSIPETSIQLSEDTKLDTVVDYPKETASPVDVTAVVSEIFQDKLSHVLQTEDGTQAEQPAEDSPSESKLDLDLKTSEHTEEKDADGEYVPARRDVDITKIVTSVAHVLKSDAPLEELASEIPLEFTPYSPYGIKGYTTELRETHITTVDSPICETTNIMQDNKEIDTNKSTEVIESKHDEDDRPVECVTVTTHSFLENEKHEASKDVENMEIKSKASVLIKDSNVLMDSTSKIISSIKTSTTSEDAKEGTQENDDDNFDNDPGIVHRMLVTASSEDGGEETVICPPGSIIFQKAENSGRSTPEGGQSPKLPLQDDIFSYTIHDHDKNELDDQHEQVDAIIDTKEKADEEEPEKDVLRSGKSTPAKEILSGKSSPDLEKKHEKFMEEHPGVNDIPSEEMPRVDRKYSTRTISESLEGSKPASVISTPESDTAEEKLHNLFSEFEGLHTLTDKLDQMKRNVSNLDELLAKDDGDEGDENCLLSPTDSPEAENILTDEHISSTKDFKLDTSSTVQEKDLLHDTVLEIEEKSEEKIEEITADSGKVTPEVEPTGNEL